MNRAQRRSIKYGNLYNAASKGGKKRGSKYQMKLVKIREPRPRIVTHLDTTGRYDINPQG